MITRIIAWLILGLTWLPAQEAPYDNPPGIEPPYYKVRYAASAEPGELIFPVQYTVWIPEGVEQLRGVIVHQHGCGEGSCKSGQTAAFDLHWQALARKHDCALLGPSYEHPQKADCQMWCDPRNGSAEVFQQALVDLGEQSGHPELASVPWALWGHSGGGHWAGGMLMLHPERVAAAWLRSGVPLFAANPDRKGIKPYTLPKAALQVPIMCNPGTKEGVTVTTGKFSKVWPANQAFFKAMRGKGGLLGVAIDPLSSHECGNQRYLAIPWLDACLTARLPDSAGPALRPMPTDSVWLAPLRGKKAQPAANYSGDPLGSIWLPNEAIARAWEHYVADTNIPDLSPPPPVSDLAVTGNQLTWNALADLDSGLAKFIIYRDGEQIATVPDKATNRFGRPIFQGLQYSDTPAAPLVPMQYTDKNAKPGSSYQYRVVAENTAGLVSN